MMRPALVLSLVPLALASCAESIWVPTERATAQLPGSGLPAAQYSLPAGGPPGSVQIGTLGVQKIKQQGGLPDRRELVLRMIVTNNSDVAFRVNVRNQVLQFESGDRMAPEMAYSSKQSDQPIVEVPPRDRVSLDLLYTVPPASKKLRDFELSWSVETPNQTVSNRTDFRKQYLEPPGYYSAYYVPPPYYYGSPLYSYGYGFDFPYYGSGLLGYAPPSPFVIAPGRHRFMGRQMTPVRPRGEAPPPPRATTPR